LIDKLTDEVAYKNKRLSIKDCPNPHLGYRINKHNWSYRIQLAKNWSHAFASGFCCILAIVELSGQAIIRAGE